MSRSTTPSCTGPHRRRRRAHFVVPTVFLLLLAAPDARARVLVIGDSNATGVGQEVSVAWTTRLKRAEGEMVQTWGGPGALLAHSLIGMAKLPQCPVADIGLSGVQAAILALGSNDFGVSVPLEAVRAGVRTLVGSATVNWICVTPPGRADEQIPNDLNLFPQDYRDAIAEECRAMGAVVIHGELVVPPNPPNLSDGLHLSKRGHILLFRAVRDAIRALEPGAGRRR